MGRPTKRTQHCRELARKPADSLYMYNTITDNAFINDNCYFTDDVIEDESSEFEVYEWNDNRLDGLGTYVDSLNVKHDIQCENAYGTGHGRIIWSDGASYEGGFFLDVVL